MPKNMPDTGYSDIDRSILYKEGMAKVLLASADEERELCVEIQRLKEKNAQLIEENTQLKKDGEQKDLLIAQLRQQLAHLSSNSITNIYNIQQADRLALGDYVHAKALVQGKKKKHYKKKNHD